MFTVYLITNLVNGKMYVGQTRRTLEYRWSNHISCAKRGDDTYFYRAILKYGQDRFDIQPLAEAKDQDELNRLETLWIIVLRTYDRNVGYNGTFGGDGCVITPETHAKLMSAVKRGKDHPLYGRTWKFTPERLAAFRIRVKNNPISDETRQRLKASRKRNNDIHSRRFRDPEFKKKLIAGLRGRKLSAEHRSKVGRSGERHHKYRHDISTDRIVDLYKNGLGLQKVADILGVSKMLIKTRLKLSCTPIRRTGRPKKQENTTNGDVGATATRSSCADNSR